MTIRQILADITTLDVDAIVNAANSQLAEGGGVCGAIYRAAGSAALRREVEADYPTGCPTGGAVITTGFALPARHVIHAVGPRWQGGGAGEAKFLASAYRSALDLVIKNKLASIAFPSISTGIYGYPINEASEIAVGTAKQFSTEHPEIDIVFCAYNQEMFDRYSLLLSK
jgi:O-acetyl-ADP-ribose deacetylase (regulator of RNase III)